MNEGTTGIAAVDAAVIWSVAAAAIAAGLGLLWRITRGVRRIMARVDEFIDDWQGTPARSGVPPRLGVMARLDRIEHELHPNSKGSLRDAVDRVDARTQQIAAHSPDS
ncbi:hypothetical protein [Streptomyces sp. NBC_01435]|uniref:hypothetical protein n=1 Tax=Streptomyces sp. NBC_01435 TaxID=2903865 RepID=UPI002E30C804|nr:hypothetical protein [Streptomyces sp. NBC_01435]